MFIIHHDSTSTLHGLIMQNQIFPTPQQLAMQRDSRCTVSAVGWLADWELTEGSKENMSREQNAVREKSKLHVTEFST